MEINGMAHVMLTVSNFDACLPFYEKLLPFLGMKPVIRNNDTLYCVGGRTALGIVRGDEKYRGEKFVQRRVGLHHLCFRARTREEVDEAYKSVREFWREDRASAGRRELGARILLGALRRSRRHSPRNQFRPRQRPPRQINPTLRPRPRDDFGVAGLAIDHQHLNLLIVALGKKHIAADGEIVRDISRLKRQ
jgi:catechol 2,3-dioxygenase-like lactoylglutathione lyase family enzyme